jgi:hypothetical protein
MFVRKKGMKSLLLKKGEDQELELIHRSCDFPAPAAHHGGAATPAHRPWERIFESPRPADFEGKAAVFRRPPLAMRTQRPNRWRWFRKVDPLFTDAARIAPDPGRGALPCKLLPCLLEILRRLGDKFQLLGQRDVLVAAPDQHDSPDKYSQRLQQSAPDGVGHAMSSRGRRSMTADESTAIVHARSRESRDRIGFSDERDPRLIGVWVSERPTRESLLSGFTPSNGPHHKLTVSP